MACVLTVRHSWQQHWGTAGLTRILVLQVVFGPVHGPVAGLAAPSRGVPDSAPGGAGGGSACCMIMHLAHTVAGRGRRAHLPGGQLRQVAWTSGKGQAPGRVVSAPPWSR